MYNCKTTYLIFLWLALLNNEAQEHTVQSFNWPILLNAQVQEYLGLSDTCLHSAVASMDTALSRYPILLLLYTTLGWPNSTRFDISSLQISLTFSPVFFCIIWLNFWLVPIHTNPPPHLWNDFSQILFCLYFHYFCLHLIFYFPFLLSFFAFHL